MYIGVLFVGKAFLHVYLNDSVISISKIILLCLICRRPCHTEAYKCVHTCANKIEASKFHHILCNYCFVLMNRGKACDSNKTNALSLSGRIFEITNSS